MLDFKTRKEFTEEYIKLLEKHNLKENNLARETLLLTMLLSPIYHDDRLTDKQKMGKVNDIAARITQGMKFRIEQGKRLAKGTNNKQLVN